jgi:hypothetical protein
MLKEFPMAYTCVENCAALGWVPPSDESSLVGFLSKKEAYNYKMCPASMKAGFHVTFGRR